METYLSYLQSHLGLDHLILPRVEPKQLSAQKALQFHCVSEREELTADEQELFLKIMAALKLSPETYELTVGGEDIPFKASYVIVFSQTQIHGDWVQEDEHHVLKTHSLISMLKNPEIKKSCWKHLSAVTSLNLQ